MSNIYEQIVTGLAQHWKAHDNKYPQKIILSPAQHRQLLDLRAIGCTALGTTGEIETDRIMGTALEVDAGSPGMLVSVDGGQVALEV